MSERLTSFTFDSPSQPAFSRIFQYRFFFQMFVIKNVHTIYRTWVSNYNMIGCKSRAVV